jgi:antitoxin CptB
MTENETPAGETLENKRKRLIFRSDHRGTKEMDLLLGSFAKKHVPDFNEDQLMIFDDILKNNDPDLYNWITGKEPEDESLTSEVFEMLKKHQYAS